MSQESKIEKGIPMPRNGGNRNTRIEWEKMEVGDSIVIKSHSQAMQATYAHRPKVFVARRMDGVIRAWRTE